MGRRCHKMIVSRKSKQPQRPRAISAAQQDDSSSQTGG